MHLASDSRITAPGVSSDYGIKVFPVPLKIFHPRNAKTGEMPLLFESVYGLGFAGSFLAAQTLREFLFIILQRLQAIPNDSDASFDGICKIVLKYVNHLTDRLSSELQLDHSVELFLCGPCPLTKTVTLAKYFNVSGNAYTVTVFRNDTYTHAIGSGKQRFAEMLSAEDTPHWTHIMSALDRMTHEDPKVGGNIQFGDFDNTLTFRTMGIIRDYPGCKGRAAVKYCLAGIDMNGDEFTPKSGDLFITGDYIDPFKTTHP